MFLRGCILAGVLMIVIVDVVVDVEDFKRKMSLRACMPAA